MNSFKMVAFQSCSFFLAHPVVRRNQKILFGLQLSQINSHLGGALETKLFGQRYRSAMIISPVVFASAVVTAAVVVFASAVVTAVVVTAAVVVFASAVVPVAAVVPAVVATVVVAAAVATGVIVVAVVATSGVAAEVVAGVVIAIMKNNLFSTSDSCKVFELFQ